jgi:hypothetical protein
MNARMKIAIALATVATLGLAAAPAPAGKSKTAKTKVKVTSVDATGGGGKVKSKKAPCKKGRRVSLLFSGDYSPVRVGTDKTDKKGRWEVDANVTERGIFYATVKKAKRGKTKCRPAESKGYRFE